MTHDIKYSTHNKHLLFFSAPSLAGSMFPLLAQSSLNLFGLEIITLAPPPVAGENCCGGPTCSSHQRWSEPSMIQTPPSCLNFFITLFQVYTTDYCLSIYLLLFLNCLEKELTNDKKSNSPTSKERGSSPCVATGDSGQDQGRLRVRAERGKNQAMGERGDTSTRWVTPWSKAWHIDSYKYVQTRVESSFYWDPYGTFMLKSMT